MVDHADLNGQLIEGRYRILELVGEGGMGCVYAADDLKLHRRVALKIVRSDQLAARFAREAMVTSRIDHPNVISALDYGTLPDGSAFLAMQLVRGKSLKEILQQEGSLHWSRACELGAQVADALCAAKHHNIVHRDLKPDNVLVERRSDGGERAKVLDFGIAKFVRDSLVPPDIAGQQVTQVGVVVGTPGYMAPEQAVGQRADHRADLYSLGVLLWEAITGNALFDGADTQSIIKHQMSRPPAPLREAAADQTIPSELEALVTRLLQLSADSRPAEPGEVRDLLRDIAAMSTAADRERKRRKRLSGKLARPPQLEAEAGAGTPPPTATQHGPSGGSTPMSGEARAPRGDSQFHVRAIVLGLTVVAAAMATLVATGQLEVRPRGELQAVAGVVGPDDQLPAPAPGRAAEEPSPETGSGLPESLEPQLHALVQAGKRSDRVAAAKALLGHIPMDDVPLYVQHVAHLQLALTCADKKKQLERLERLDDMRSLPALVMNSQRSKEEGCGPKGRRDCLACMRAELDDLIRTFQDRQMQANSPAAP